MAQKPNGWFDAAGLKAVLTDGESPVGPSIRKYVAVQMEPMGPMDPLHQPRRMKFVFSDGSVDRDNDIIDPKGWDLRAFLANPVILWAHDSRSLPVGKAVEVRVEAERLVGVVEFATHPFAETVFQLIQGGFLRAVSVGFRALEYAMNEERRGVDFKRQELLETSIVPVPANANALIAASAAGVDLEPLRKWVEDTVVAWPGELRLKGKAWDKLQGESDEIISRTKIGEIETEIRVDATQAIEKLAVLEATVDRVAMKAAALSSRVETLTGGGAIKVEAVCHRALVPDEDPIRWNCALSKTFDVAAQEFPPKSREQALAAAYLETPIKRLHAGSISIRSARVGAFLVALDDFIRHDSVLVDDLRNLDQNGREAPPVYEDIQLNSKLTRNFLVDGMRFLRWNDAKLCLRVEPRWHGLEVTHYAVREQQQQNASLVVLERVLAAAKALKFLQGEAFTLGGEFLARGTETADDLILDDKNATAVRRLVGLVNEKGAEMECRGALLVGPPGTGKTLSGRIIMNVAQATFVWVSARDFAYSGGFHGMADAFQIARECAPSVLFIEDVDNWLDGHTVDLFKTEMDGIRQHKGVLTILTSNYPELLPKALIDRPGRFHDVLRFGLPDETVRTAMLAKWLPDLSVADRQRAVEATAGMSGAHVRELVRFVGIVSEQDGLDLSAALTTALAKLQEQRDLITAIQAQGSRYRAPAHVIGKAIARGVVDARSAALQLDDTYLADLGPDDGCVLELVEDERDCVLELIDESEDKAFEIDPAQLRASLREVVAASMAAMARESTELTLRKMRGRLD